MRMRPMTKRDAATLKQFECARPVWYELEVEEYIRSNVADFAGRDRRVLVFDEQKRIVAVGIHDPERDPSGSGSVISWLSAVAIRLDRQGSTLPSGERLSDLVLAAVIKDALRTAREPVVAAYLAEQNTRSIRMCARAGLVDVGMPEVMFSPILGAT